LGKVSEKSPSFTHSPVKGMSKTGMHLDHQDGEHESRVENSSTPEPSAKQKKELCQR